MDTLKKAISWRPALAAVAAVLLAAGAFTLLAGEKPESGYLGVSVQSLDSVEKEKLGVTHGVEVAAVEKESAAAKAGIKENDVILQVNGEKVRRAQDLVEIVGELAPGASVKIGLWRDGKALDATAVLGKRGHAEKFVRKSKAVPHVSISGGYLGVVLRELDEDLAPYFGVKTGEGALIIGVEKDTPAGKAGLKGGDVIVQMGDKAIQSADDVRAVLSGLKKGDSVVLAVVRHGKKETLKVEPDFDRQRRVIRIYRNGHDMDVEQMELPDMDVDAPEFEFEIPPLPDMHRFEEKLRHVHEKMDRVKINVEKHLEKIGESDMI